MGREVKLPSTLLFPIEIVELLVPPNQQVQRHDRLIKFKYWNRIPDGVPEEGEEQTYVTREFYGHFDSPHEGELTKWLVKVGDRVNDEFTPVVVIDEGCDHSVQFGGLCALCGRNLEEKDYMGYSDADRAPIAMSHDTAGLTVSRDEAERLEHKSTQQLLKDRRLILVVDLDQTVIHASVTPEIAQWMADPEAPQHEAVKDVRSFSLRDREGGEQNWYFVKVRPGLSRFLEEMNSKYEMHVYTMATKQYALKIAKAIDPDGKYFADRILSRDASGSLLHKDLKRLFPVSTQMVTIIDDRGDVWNWSPNLIRVVPYQFWSNTGDINSQFLPKRSGLVTPESLNSGGDGGGGGGPVGIAGSDEDSSDEVLAHDNDHELRNVGRALSKLHTQFYDRVPNKPTNMLTDGELPDVGKLLPALKSQVFDGCVLLFSGFFPLGTTDLDSADIVQWVRSFGAVVLADFLPSVTHVVARNVGTLKARQAAGRKKMVVGIEWVFSCLENWERVDEKPFILDVPNPVLPGRNDNGEDHHDERADEMDPNIAEGFMRSLQRGDVNWDAMDEELKELLADDDEDDFGDEDEDDEEAHDAHNIDGEHGNGEHGNGERSNGEHSNGAEHKQHENELEADKEKEEARASEPIDIVAEDGDTAEDGSDGAERQRELESLSDEENKVITQSHKRKREDDDFEDDLGLDGDWD